MNIPPKYEDVVAKLDAALGREDALREELDRHKSLYNQLEKALSRVHCMYGKRLLDLTGERQTVLVPDEEFVKYFEELKCLKVENSALQQRLTVAEQRAAVMEKALSRIAREHDCGCSPCTGSCTSQVALEITVDAMRDIAIAALKPAEGEVS